MGLSFSGEILNKAMLSGVNTDTKERFSKKIQSENFDLELSNGNWDLYLTYWESPQYFAADTSCKLQKISLVGEPVELVFDVNTEGCKEYSQHYDSTGSNFYQTKLIACNSSPALNSSPSGNECDGDKNNSILSYKIELKSYQQEAGSEFIRFGEGIENCIPANSNGGQAFTFENSNGNPANFLPIVDSGESPFIVHLKTYSDAACGDFTGQFEFNDGLQKAPTQKHSSTIWASSGTNSKNYLYFISGNVVLPPPVLDPTTISGLSLWLDGADQATMFSNTDCISSPVAATNDPVKCWKDKSGNILNAIEGSAPPLFEQTVRNGLGGLSFYDNILSVSDDPLLDAGSGITIYMVYTETVKDHTLRVLLGKSFSTQRTIDLYLGNTDKIINFTDDGSASKTGYTSTSPVNIPQLVSLQITNSGQTMMRDGSNDASSIVTGGLDSVIATVVDNSGALKIGNSVVGTSTYLKGHIMEILYFDRELTVQEKLDVDGYLKTKWDL
jgi:hypothetical protein